MGIFDWLGPTSLTKRRGWDALPSITSDASMTAAKSSPPFFVAPPVQVTTLTYTPPGWQFSYEHGSSNGAMNSAVAACLQAIATAIAEPELRVYRADGSERVEAPPGDLGYLLQHPNPHMSLDTLLGYLATCLHVDGNAYWRKLRAGDPETGPVVELWPISPSRMTVETVRGSGDFISHYRYAPGGASAELLRPGDVVHFRYGLDDRDHRIGHAPLKRLLREISSDDQATRYADRLLANLAINGLTLSFDKEAAAIDQATADQLKARIQAAYGGDNVGGAAVLSPGARLDALGFSPEQMNMEILHRVPEERISAVLGVPAIVAGLGAGLQRATYSNVREAREMFTEQKLIPLWRAISAEITLQLVPDFDASGRTIVELDTSEVRALGDDQNAAATRLKTLVEAGILTLDEARAEIGYEPRPVHDAPNTSQDIRRVASRAILRPVSRTESKAAEDLPGLYDDLRADELPSWERELVAFLTQQQRRVMRRLNAGANMAAELVTEGEAVLLGETLTPLQLRVLGEVQRLVIAELGIAFDLDDPGTRQFLADAGANIVGITDTTRAAVQAALVEGQQAGEGIPELARRLRDLPVFGQARAETVARTELGTSQNHAALASYRASGVVVGVRVLDGDYDDACAAMNGRTFALGQEPPPLQHPNCTRSYAPLTDAAELTRSA
jgi:HK97 family phage portal protein